MKSSRASTDPHTLSKQFDHHSNSNTNTIINNINNTTTTTNTSSSTTFPPHIFYEPTSVLDPHLPPPSSDDWDPVSWLLADATDPPSPSPSPSFDPFDVDLPLDLLDTTTNNNSNNIPPAPILPSFDRGHLDLLLRAAGCVEANDPVAAHMILARLSYAFPPSSPRPTPLPALHRAALHFRDALLSLLPIPNPPSASPPPSPLETVHRITAQKSFSDLSPIPQFTSFTANQTLLESLLLLDHNSNNNSSFNSSSSSSSPPTSIHVIDFDLGLGGQWSSFAQEIHARSRSLRASPPAVRITAVVPEETVETALAAENLRDFARAVGVRLSIDFVRVGALGALALAGVRLSAAEPVGVVLSPTVFRLLGGSPESSVALLRFVRRVSPRVVVFVDTECFAAGGPSFRRSFAGGLEFYSAVLESVDAAAAATGAGEEPVRRVERSVLRPRIFSSVSMWAPREASDWRETFAAGGMAPVAFSEFTESQAEWLLRRAPAEGFHVARREGSMMLSWKGRELAATSAWRCL